MYRAKERLYLTTDGRIVREGDPDAHSLFVRAGGYVPFQLARRYGLDAEEGPAVAAHETAPEVAARLAPPATTAHTRPARKGA